MLIQRCSALPTNFPVTDDMISHGAQFGLEDEMRVIDLFLCNKFRNDVFSYVISTLKESANLFSLISRRKATYSCVTTSA